MRPSTAPARWTTDDATGAEVPAEFAAFIAAHGPTVTRTIGRLTGNDQITEILRRDLFAAVALRWRWHQVRPGGRRAREAFLRRLLRREARALAPRRQRRNGRDAGPDRNAPDTVPRDAPTSPPDEPQRVWTYARSLRRRRRLIAVGLVAAISLLWTVGPRTSPGDASPESPIGPTAIPAGVTVLPPFTHLPGLDAIETGLPQEIHINLATAPDLRDAPLARAAAVFRPELGPLVVLAEDGTIRIVNDSLLLQARAITTSLSPDGTRVALPSANGLVVVDVPTATLRSLDLPTLRLSEATLVWRTPTTVVVPSLDGALEVNVETGDSVALSGVTGRDVMSANANPSLVELIGPTSGAERSRIRFWGDSAAPGSQDGGGAGSSAEPAAAGDFADREVDGPPWLANWSGPGWISETLAVRNCSAREIPLPWFVGRARSAVAAVTLAGDYTGTLVTVDTNLLEPLGFTDPRRVLVAVHAPPNATMVLAWYPHTAQLRRVTTIDKHAVVSLPASLS